MVFDDRAADREAKPRALGLGGRKGLEQARAHRRIDAGTTIGHAHLDAGWNPCRAQHHQALAAVPLDGLDGIAHQVQHDLLQLDRITDHLHRARVELDEETHEVYRAGNRVQLSPTEFKLLRYLMLNANRVLSKAQILDHVWNYDFNGEANVVESYISYLRRKVDTTEPRLLHTLRGVGYVLRLPR